MRILRNFLGLFLLTAFIFSCVDENESNADFVASITEPANISSQPLLEFQLYLLNHFQNY